MRGIFLLIILRGLSTALKCTPQRRRAGLRSRQEPPVCEAKVRTAVAKLADCGRSLS